MFPTLIAGGLVAVVATAGMGNGPADADRPHADPPDRMALASSTRDAMASPGERESLAGTTTTTAPKLPPPPPTTTTTAPPPPPPPPPPEPDPEDVAAERAPGADIVCPVDGAVEFVDSWGAARSGGRAHKGTDMMAGHGTPTVAPVSGSLEQHSSSAGGLAWYVHGDDGNTYYGAHLSAYENQGAGWVEAGTVIGYVGDSGNAAGTPHLHFEYHPGGGAPVNPYGLVSAAC
jgi:murein DD-endopeptidase MepM/ murein hydrolase activator NlpD